MLCGVRTLSAQSRSVAASWVRPCALATPLARPWRRGPARAAMCAVPWARHSSTDERAKTPEAAKNTGKQDVGGAGSSTVPSVSASATGKTNIAAKLSRSSSERREFSRLFQLIRGERWALAGGLLLVVFSAGISLTLPAIIGKILDSVNDPSPDKLILGLEPPHFFMAAAAVFTCGSVGMYFRIVVLRSIGERIVCRLRSRVFRRIIEQDATFFDANRTGDLISRLGADATVVARAVTGNVADGLRAILTAGMAMGMMSYISLKLTALITVCLPPALIGTWLYGRRVRTISRQFQKALGSLTRVSEERLNNIKTAQACGGETQELRIYNKQVRNVFHIAMQDARASGLYSGAMQLMGNSVVIGLLAIGAHLVSNKTLTFGELSSFIMYTAYAGGAVSGLGNFYSELMKGAGAASRLFEIEDKKPSIPPFKGQPLRNPLGDIGFHHVEFAYPTRPSVQIFNDLTVTINSKSHVVIVGQSGGGKSTIISLLLRFYDPERGCITIGDQKLTDVSPWSLRHHIGVVSQEPVLFNGTVAENIQYGKESATREEVLAAAEQANCTFLDDFPDGIDTTVGPRGAQLSGGQKQRIAIARAIVSRPSILILDEATSALDGESEALVNAALTTLIKSTATTISIAHRLSTIAKAEEVIVLGQGGKVLEHGKFVDLFNDPHSALSELLARRQELVTRAPSTHVPAPTKHHEHHEHDEEEHDLEDESDESQEHHEDNHSKGTGETREII